MFALFFDELSENQLLFRRIIYFVFPYIFAYHIRSQIHFYYHIFLLLLFLVFE